MIDFLDQRVLNSHMYDTSHRSYLADDDQTHVWTGLVNRANLSAHPFGTGATDWNLAPGSASSVATTQINGVNNQADSQSSIHQLPGVNYDGMQRSVLENADENNIATDMDRSPLTSVRSDSLERNSQAATPTPDAATKTTLIRCWLHGCNGRSFTHLSNYRRHCREKSRQEAGFSCLVCGKRFTRKAAWKTHVDQQRCKFIDYDANGVPFERKRHPSAAMDAMGVPQMLPQ